MDNIVHVARSEQDKDVWIDFLDFVTQLFATHDRHDCVGKQQINGPLIFSRFFQGFLSVNYFTCNLTATRT